MVREVFETLIFGPWELLCDCVFTMIVQRLHRPGLSILLMSLVFAVLTAPFQPAGKPVSDRERKTGFPPRFARSFFPLIWEAFFLLSACRYFSDLQLLQGVPFGPFQDLGSSVLLKRVTAGFLLFLAGFALFSLPAGFFLRRLGKHCSAAPSQEKNCSGIAPFSAACVFLVILTGLLVPSTVISLSPEEFVHPRDVHSPLQYLLSSCSLAAGTFLVWAHVLYASARRGMKTALNRMFPAAAVISGIDVLFFGKTYGNMSALLQYDRTLSIPLPDYALNTAVVLAVAACILFLSRRKKDGWIRMLLIAECIAISATSAINCFTIYEKTKDLTPEPLLSSPSQGTILPLDRTGKNVVVIMLDRAISGFVPYLLAEKPEVLDQFAGFTYYPNTISYGGYTNVGTPPLFGGYDYIPEKINERADVPLVYKQNEALKIMPINFLSHGYDVTVCDPPYANYRALPDLSIFDDIPEIHAYNTMGMFSDNAEEIMRLEDEIRNRNLFCYSIFRASPLLFQTTLYNNGLYNQADGFSLTIQVMDGLSESRGIRAKFNESYDVLKNLPAITEITDTGKPCFLMLSNNTTHEPMILQEPQYEPEYVVDNTEYDAAHTPRAALNGAEPLLLETQDQIQHYDVNMAALIRLGNWFDALRREGVYDNTRIILVSDHGRELGLFGLQTEDPAWTEDLMLYQALYLVKDFNCTEFRIDDSFMTVADTPTLAFSGLFDDAVNPFLGTPVTDAQKYADEQHLLMTEWSLDFNNGTTFLEDQDSHWLTLKNGDLFDLQNWSCSKTFPS